jgi:protein tyrosine/serine phosphatase
MIDKGALIIHCEGGRDRVGIIIALLLDMLGVEREYIIEDYMASFNGTSREIIEFLFNLIDNEFGGTMNYLKKECNVKDKTIKKLTRALIN